MFERLPFRSQEEAIARDGTLIAQRHHKGWTVTLFALHHTFVELWSGRDAEVFSTFKKSARAVDVLEPYLEGMDIQDYLKFQK